jgi:HPt (histidine-containing phosphotransfer) domain-containing protein
MGEKKAPTALADGIIRLGAVLRECEENAAVAARRKGLRVYVYDEVELPQPLSDPSGLVKRAVAGLLGCSVGAAARGAVTLVARRSENAEGRVALRIEVSDAGIAPRDAALADARDAVKTFGGELEVWTLEDVGTRTVLTLELSLARESAEAIDRALGLKNCAGSDKIYRSALRALAEDAGKEARELRRCALCGDYTAARKIAHTWKGSAAIIGAVRLAELAAILEEAFQRDGSYFRRHMLTDYEYELSRAIEAVAKGSRTDAESPSRPPPQRVT